MREYTRPGVAAYVARGVDASGMTTSGVAASTTMSTTVHGSQANTVSLRVSNERNDVPVRSEPVSRGGATRFAAPAGVRSPGWRA